MGRESVCVCMFVCCCETIIQTRDVSRCCIMPFGVCWLNQDCAFFQLLLPLDPWRGKVGVREEGRRGKGEGGRKEKGRGGYSLKGG